MNEITREELQQKLGEDQTFCDYFNKFCCLPVFGQRLSYLQRSSKFVYDPIPIRRRLQGFKISNDMVREWLITERLELFKKSKLASEYNLCKTLQRIRYNEQSQERRSSLGMLQSDPHLQEKNGYLLLDGLKQEHLCKVRHMKKFINFVENTKLGNKLISFWIEVDYLKRGDEETKQALLRNLRRNYYTTNSSTCLPCHLLEKVYAAQGKRAMDKFGFDFHYTIKLQNLILKRLHFYWLPRYLVSCKNIGRSEEMLIRKLKIMESSLIEEELTKRSIETSKSARYIPDPDKEGKVEEKGGTISTVTIEEERDLFDLNKELGLDEQESRKDLFKTKKSDPFTTSSRSLRESYEKKIGPPVEQVSLGEILTFESEDEFHQVSKLPMVGSGEWRKYPESKKRFFLKKVGSSSSATSSASSEAASLSPANSWRQQFYASHQLQAIEEGSSDSDEEHGEAVKKFKKLKSIKRRIGPVHSDVMPQVELKKKRRTASSSKALRRCRSDLSQVKESLPLLPKFFSYTQAASRYYQRESDADQTTSCPAVAKTTTEVSPSRSSSSFELGIGRDEDNETGKFRIRKEFELSEFAIEPARKPRLDLEAEKARLNEKLINENEEEYLRHVESGISLSDILASDLLAASPFGEFLAKDAGSGSVDLMTAGGDNSHKLYFFEAYDIWQRAEDIRTTYYALSSCELKKKVDNFCKSFASGRDTPLQSKLRALKLRNDKPLPPDLVDLQQQIEKMMEQQWIKFAINEQEHFRLRVLTSEMKVFRRRNSFPSSIPEIIQNPILPSPLLQTHPDDNYDEFESHVKAGKLESLVPSGIGHMKYRISRAYRLLAGQTSRDASMDSSFMQFVGEESSDEEGGLPMTRPKVFVRVPEISLKDLSKLSAREYPRATLGYRHQCLVLRKRMHQKVEKLPLYMRPVKRKGMVVYRPTERPECLEQVLRDPLHFEFFKKYMKMHNSEAPVLFWKAVEVLKRMVKPEQRQAKAEKILKTFFSDSAARGAILLCNADIINEIASADTVTTSMLVEAAYEVFKSMELNWAQRYFNTFASMTSLDIPDEEEETRRINMEVIKTSRMWIMFTDFMRRLSCFLKCMKNPTKFEHFRNYLKRLPIRTSDIKLRTNASSTAILFKKYETTYYRDRPYDLEAKYRRKEILGNDLIINFIVNDFVFWFETDKYRAMCDNIKHLKKHGRYEKSDMLVVKEKRSTILKCFLDSNIPPLIRINVPPNIAGDIMGLSRRFDVHRNMFYKARLIIIPVLIHFWTKYRNEMLFYESKKEVKVNHHTEVEKRRKKIYNKKLERRKMLLNKSLDPHLTPGDTFLPESLSRDDFNKRKKKEESRLLKVKGLVHTDPPKLNFSLEHGLKLVIPPKAKIIEKVKGYRVEEEEEESEQQDKNEFVKVWTRGARFVNVIGQGSDPILVGMGRQNKNVTVKCDMVEF